MLGFKYDTFNVNLIDSTFSAAFVAAAAKVLGKLGYHAVNTNVGVCVGGVAAAVAQVSQNYFKSIYAYYAGIPAGVAAGYGALRLLSPQVAQSLNLKGAVAIAVILAASKFIYDRLPAAYDKVLGKDDNGDEQVLQNA